MMKYILFLLLFSPCMPHAQEWYLMPINVKTGWISFENAQGARGQGGMENKGAKGHPSEMVQPGEQKVLLDTKGAGTIRRIWLTVSDRSPQMLRSLRLDMWWDGEKKAAVSVPLGDFFGIGLGRTTRFENVFFSNPEGRSFNSYVPMPYRKGARIVLTNESDKAVNLFYDINILQVDKHPGYVMYLHAFWNRNTGTKLGEDFEILPAIKGKGRFLGCNLGIITDSVYANSWWGEGEVKMYLDGDAALPSLVGTGTEDYVGTGWGQGAYAQQYQGCPVADDKNRQWTFYRYHIPDPVYFYASVRVTIQQMGGDMSPAVKKIAAAGARLVPVTVATDQRYLKLLELNPTPKISDPDFPEGWTNFYRLDNYSATAYFYLDRPSNSLPALAPVQVRTEGLMRQP